MATCRPAAAMLGMLGFVVGWREATQEALYGPSGFFRREAPGTHFRTSVHASPLFADAIARLAEQTDATTVVDVGAGRGELLTRLRQIAPSLTLIGVELAPRPTQLPTGIDWRDSLNGPQTDVLMVANEWLDNVPVDVVEVDEDGAVRRVEVEPATGKESLAEPVTGRDSQWLATWWPLDDATPGMRAEIGWPRDEAWTELVRALHRGVLLAIDYFHVAGSRPPYGSLTSYQAGRQAHPVPDGSRDITSHVALDSVAAAGTAAGVTDTVLMTQREALRTLGVDGTLPSHAIARTDPAAYARALEKASGARELLAPGGLGAFGWLLQGVHQPLPRVLIDRDGGPHP